MPNFDFTEEDLDNIVFKGMQKETQTPDVIQKLIDTARFINDRRKLGGIPTNNT